jgi:uncharacterized membrane protein
MADDLQDTIREILTHAAKQSAKSVGGGKGSGGLLSGLPGVAAGAGVAALVPLAAKGIGKIASGAGSNGLGDFAEKLSGGGGGSGGAGGAVTDALKSALPFGGGSSGGGGGGSKDTVPGVGKGRRMPVQQSVDIGAPIETVYNQFTQFELWPNFMHRVIDISQKDDCSVSFSTKIWGKKKEFEARIETQRPNERIKWKVTQGMSHTGVITFHELSPRLTRVLVGLDVEPGGMLEKAARGLRHVKRAVRGDLHRFKAFIEIQEVETGAWRGVIEKGKVVESHDESYDNDRQYSKFEDIFKGPRAEKATPERQGASSGSGRSSRRSSGRSSSSSGSSRSSSGSRQRSGSSRSSSKSGGRSSGSSSRSRGATNGSSGSSSSSRGRSRSSNHSGGRSRSRRGS